MVSRAHGALALAALAVVLRVATAEEFSGCIPTLGLSLTRLSSLKVGNWTGSSSIEVLDYDPESKLTAVVEARVSATTPLALLILNFADAAAPVIHHRILVGASAGEGSMYGTPNSVSVWNGYAALALDGSPSTSPGFVRIYHMASGAKVGEVQVCAMPDSVKWTSEGRRLIVACEGEPATQTVVGSNPTVEPNPSGAIGIVYVTKAGSYTPVGSFCPVTSFNMSAKVLGFQPYIDSLSTAEYELLLSKGLRVDPRLTKATAAKDIEPEYIALPKEKNPRVGWVTLQENNAVASLDLTFGSERILAIWPLGLKDWSNNGTSLRSFDNLYSWFQPDTITYAKMGRRGLLFLANEGDSKEEALRVKDLAGGLDPTAFPNAALLRQDGELGRLTVDPLFGIKGGYNTSKAYNEQGPYEKLIAYGGRSWSILDATTGKLVYESGDAIESIMAAHPLASLCFNCDRESNAADSRSDNAGPEPEAIEVFKRGSRWYAAIGLERMGGFLLYDVTDPAQPVYGDYVYNRNWTLPSSAATSLLGDLAPEMIKYVPAEHSNNGQALLLLANEASATVSTWGVDSC
ncbi:Gigasin-3a [Tetrabaena socialis]|uniref:Gigasin-3a n=1 Tax=Tetrabaena socialis TaxID=47790 RepID=A0A2J7ZZX1_9CHLO|nr:Gigasin-3a [Tetrabaena socialis]|eukprot:PNH05822.1 Gigasin-3a [Tetrabaena socialis]